MDHRKESTRGYAIGAESFCVKLTCNIRACGVWTKYDTFPFGADCKQSWPSVATGLYINTMPLDSLPS